MEEAVAYFRPEFCTGRRLDPLRTNRILPRALGLGWLVLEH